jgi:hypothetical protein
MIGWRDLVFLGLVGGGLAILGTNLIPPARPTPTTGHDSRSYQSLEFRRAVSQVDHLFEQHWETEKLAAAQPAPDLIVARRLALGLMGTIPSLEELRQFESLPPAERIPWWIDHILKDRRYAEHLAERFRRVYCGSDEGPFVLYRGSRFRTWLADQFAQHRPYNALVRDLIAGSGLWTDQPSTNFITATSLAQMKNQPDPVKLAGRVTRAFLGLRLDCAQCHNHPFAAWKQSDFEGFTAFFGQTHVGFTGVQDGGGEYRVEEKKTREMRVVPPSVPFASDLLPKTGSRRSQLAAWVTHPKNPYFARATVNRMWAILTGRPLVEPVDNLEPTGSPGDNSMSRLGAEVLRVLGDDFAEHGFDLQRLIRQIASTRVFQIDSAAEFDITEAHEEAWAVFPLTRLRPEQVAGSTIQAAALATLDTDSHILVRLMKFGQQNDFIKRYGDELDDEFDQRGGTIPQRLLMMNGALVREKIKENPLNASTRIAWLAPSDAKAVEVAYLATLSRRPTPEEATHFTAYLRDSSLKRTHKLEDIYWSLVNSTEFSWNH